MLLCYYYHGGRNVFAEDVRLRRFAGWIDGGESVEELIIINDRVDVEGRSSRL